MSRYVKDLITLDLRNRLTDVQDAVLVDLVGMTANQTVELRRQLRGKDIHVLVVKNSLARRATEGTPLRAAFEGAGGSLAVCWGSEDFVSLVKEVVALDKDEQVFPKFEARGGVMDGEQLTAERVRDISKWPNRLQQLGILSGQIISVGSQLSSQLIAVGGALASQIEQISKGGEDGEDAA